MKQCCNDDENVAFLFHQPFHGLSPLHRIVHHSRLAMSSLSPLHGPCFAASQGANSQRVPWKLVIIPPPSMLGCLTRFCVHAFGCPHHQHSISYSSHSWSSPIPGCGRGGQGPHRNVIIIHSLSLRARPLIILVC